MNIRGYICTCLALFFIFDFIQLLKYQILQFHTFFLYKSRHAGVEWQQPTFAVMTETYRILKELGNDQLRRYIYENIAEPTFDSHRITSRFPEEFRPYYERMLSALAREGDDTREPHRAIANQIGNYLRQNSRALEIEKIGEVTSMNMNGRTSRSSLWKKTASR